MYSCILYLESKAVNLPKTAYIPKKGDISLLILYVYAEEISCCFLM